MRFKPDVRPTALTPQIVVALIVAEKVYADHGATDLVVTSLNDGRHSDTSLHYAGAAADIRTRSDLPHGLPPSVDPAAVARDIAARLAEGYDVIFEGDHIHIEYQPRRPT